jgi:hypothetical protein
MLQREDASRMIELHTGDRAELATLFRLADGLGGGSMVRPRGAGRT